MLNMYSLDVLLWRYCRASLLSPEIEKNNDFFTNKQLETLLI